MQVQCVSSNQLSHATLGTAALCCFCSGLHNCLHSTEFFLHHCCTSPENDVVNLWPCLHLCQPKPTLELHKLLFPQRLTHNSKQCKLIWHQKVQWPNLLARIWHKNLLCKIKTVMLYHSLHAVWWNFLPKTVILWDCWPTVINCRVVMFPLPCNQLQMC